MARLTKLDLERKLLAGDRITWRDAKGKEESLQLTHAVERRLFAYLLRSGTRESKGLSTEFVDGLAAAFTATLDPAADARSGPVPVKTASPWKLKSIETEGFGGVNELSGPPFRFDFERESYLLQGPNGSGKSSLVGAVLWAISGQRPRDHSDARPEVPAEVLGEDDTRIGEWPPLACYPRHVEGLKTPPQVRVELRFSDDTGKIATIERRLSGNEVSATVEPGLELPDVLVETGLLMPSRMAAIRFAGGGMSLTGAVQKLTGLDELAEIGQLVDGLCHKGREYLTSKARELLPARSLFDNHLATARQALSRVDLTVPQFAPSETDTPEGELALLGKRCIDQAVAFAARVSGDLTSGLDLTNTKTQRDVAELLTVLRARLAEGLEVLPSWKQFALVQSVLAGEEGRKLVDAADLAASQLLTAADIDKRAKADDRLQLKALASKWHQEHGGDEMDRCPLCQHSLLELPELAGELKALKDVGESVTRRLRDNVNDIRASLYAAIPTAIRSYVPGIAKTHPRAALFKDLEDRFCKPEQYGRLVSGFVRLFGEHLSAAPAQELADTNSNDPSVDNKDLLEAREYVKDVRYAIAIAQWFTVESPTWREWWAKTAGSDTALGPESADLGAARRPGLTGALDELSSAGQPREALLAHLNRVSLALEQAEPYRVAGEALRQAWPAGKKARVIQKEQEARESIASTLSAMKALDRMTQSHTRQAIDELSGRIGTILQRIHICESFTFAEARLERKTGLLVRGKFAPAIKIDASLVANTSWLRAVLWAFLFSLREEALDQLTQDPFPFLMFDDPQATFDVQHRHRWAQEIASLQQGPSRMQIIIATHDEVFLEFIKIDGVQGRDGTIVAPGPDLGHISILEGAALDRLWAKVGQEKTPTAARGYMNAARIYIEGTLRIMLRGETANASSMVMGALRNKIEELHKAGHAPWDKPEFGTLASRLGHGIAEVKFLETVHHATGVNLGIAEATAVEAHLRRKLLPALDAGFRLVREHRHLHGEFSALQAPQPTCSLPEGHKDDVRRIRLSVIGQAAALTEGRTADGRVNLDFDDSPAAIELGRHLAFRVTRPTLEPVARRGDIVLVDEFVEPTPRSLVVGRYGDRLLARRYEQSDNHSDVTVLTAQSINPRDIAAPIVSKRALIDLSKIVGVLFGDGLAGVIDESSEVCDIGSIVSLSSLAALNLGLVKVVGRSAEPIALDGQYLIVSDVIGGQADVTNWDGKPVIAGDDDQNRYFKRLRLTSKDFVVLESLEIGGDYPPVILSIAEGTSASLERIWPVHGVLFELPT